MSVKFPFKKIKILMHCIKLIMFILFIFLIPLLFLYWLGRNLYFWFLNKFNLDRSIDKIKITEIDEQCSLAIEELNKIENKDWIKKYALLFHSVYIQHTGPSPNHILNTYRGKEYKNITKFVNEFRKTRTIN
jgi:hypothetical protein